MDILAGSGQRLLPAPSLHGPAPAITDRPAWPIAQRAQQAGPQKPCDWNWKDLEHLRHLHFRKSPLETLSKAGVISRLAVKGELHPRV